MNAFFREVNLSEINCPCLHNFPDNFTLPNGTDIGMSVDESRAIRHPFLEKMFQLGYLTTVPLDTLLTEHYGRVYFFIFLI